METLQELGIKVKAKYPEYSRMSDIELGRRVRAKYPVDYSDFVEAEADRLQDKAQHEINRNMGVFSSSIFLYGLATVILLLSMYFLYYANWYAPYQRLVITGFCIGGIIVSIYLYKTGYGARYEEYEFAKKQNADRLEAATAQENFQRVIANRSVQEEERQTRIAQSQAMQAESGLRVYLTNLARSFGLDVNSFIGVTRRKIESDIDEQVQTRQKLLDHRLRMEELEGQSQIDRGGREHEAQLREKEKDNEFERMVQKFVAQLRSADMVDYDTKIRELESEIDDLETERQRLKKAKMGKLEKNRKLDRIDDKVERREEEISARRTARNRFLSSANWEDRKRLGS